MKNAYTSPVKKAFKSNEGFSLVELIIVVAIMAILVAMIAPALRQYINRAKKASDMEAARVIGEALERVLILDADARKEWESLPKAVWYNVTDYEGNNYTLLNAFEFTMSTGRSNDRHGTLRDAHGGKLAHTYQALVEELGQKQLDIDYREYCIGQFKIFRREDNAGVEVWVSPVPPGTDGEGQGNGWTYYRLYPNPDPRYMSNEVPVARNASANGRTTQADRTFPR